MAGTGIRGFCEPGVQRSGGIPELVLLSAQGPEEAPDMPQTGDRDSDPADTAGAAGNLWLPKDPRDAKAARHPRQLEDGLAHLETTRLALLYPAAHSAARQAARGASQRAGTEPALGFGHYEYQDLGRPQGAAGCDCGLRGSLSARLALGTEDAF